MSNDAATVSGEWVEVREEARGGEIVLRPADADLPPARARRRLSLLPGGQTAEGGPGSDDRIAMTSTGGWTVADRHLHIANGAFAGRYWIREASRDRLVLMPE